MFCHIRSYYIKKSLHQILFPLVRNLPDHGEGRAQALSLYQDKVSEHIVLSVWWSWADFLLDIIAKLAVASVYALKHTSPQTFKIDNSDLLMPGVFILFVRQLTIRAFHYEKLADRLDILIADSQIPNAAQEGEQRIVPDGVNEEVVTSESHNYLRELHAESGSIALRTQLTCMFLLPVCDAVTNSINKLMGEYSFTSSLVAYFITLAIVSKLAEVILSARGNRKTYRYANENPRIADAVENTLVRFGPI